MITWLQNATGKHNRIIFGFLLVVIVVSFVFYGFAGRGALTGGPAYMYQGVNLNDPAVRKRHNDALFFGRMTGPRMAPSGLVQRVAELALADGLAIPSPSAVEIRRLAREFTAGFDSKGNDGLNKFLEIAGKQLDASDLDVRARFETFIKDSWRIQKARGAVAGSGHVTASQINRMLDRARTKWTVDVATLSAAGFKPDVKVDEAKVKEAFNTNIEDYRLPARVAVTAVTIASTVADTAPVSDDEIINMGYNQAEKFKFETGKIKEQALAKRAELEKLVRADRAILKFAGDISDELAEKFPIDAAKADSKELAAWIKAKNAKLTTIPAFDVNASPSVAGVPAEALRVAGELTEKEWRTEVYRSEAGATFILLNQRTPDRLPTFEEAKAKAVEAWKKSQFNRLLAEEANKMAKGINDDIAAGKSFTDSAKARKLTLTSPEAFTARALPESLRGANESTELLIEAAGVGKVTSPVRTANGDYVFIRPAKAELPKDASTAEESRMVTMQFSMFIAENMAEGLVKDIVPPPVEAN